MILQFLGTAADWVSSTRDHLESIIVNADFMDTLESQLEVQQGSQRYGEYRSEDLHIFIEEKTLDNGSKCVDCTIVAGDPVWKDRLSAPLASPTTLEVQATRETFEAPADGNLIILTPYTPRYGGLSGFVKEPATSNYRVVLDWEQRQPGVSNGYMQGELATDAGKVWIQPLNLPEASEGALNGGSYSRPSAPSSLWITKFVEQEPLWESGVVYTQPRVVRWPNNGTDGPLHRYNLLTASETSGAGREPHHAYMWAVWNPLGPAG